jgi:UDP-N-acetylglucosamine 2-epimerase
MMVGIEKVLLKERPAMVLVYGDTNSTLAGALAAAKLNIKVAHVEAGLRSYNKAMPEEINRVLTDIVSGILFCPTKTAVRNLEREGISKGVHLVGDVMYDALKKGARYMKRPGYRSPYILCTIHRAENTESRRNMKEIFRALGRLGRPHARAAKANIPTTTNSLPRFMFTSS